MEAPDLDTKEMLSKVNKAIYTILVGGQSYKIGSRQLTRADLSMLYKMKNDLQAGVVAAEGGELMDRAYAAFFEGR